MDVTGENPRSFKVLMIPYVAHGHVSPFLELAKTLSNTNIFSVYFCTTPIVLKSIEEKVRVSMQKVQLVELHLPSLPELPPSLHTTKGLPLHLHPILKLAFEMAIPNFDNIFNMVNPDLIIYDFNQPWVSSLASSRKIPSVYFLTGGATATSFYYRLCKRRDVIYPFPSICPIKSDNNRNHKVAVASTSDILSTKSGYSDHERNFSGLEESHRILLARTSRCLEEEKIDFLSHLLNSKKIVPVGSLVQEHETKEQEVSEQDSKIFEWLSNKKDSSTVFVSFGSEYVLTKEEMQAIALGLELSNVDFIGVIRVPNGDKIEEALPEGFLERVKDRSIIVEGWAPQSRILKHPSIGGFVSHCGWGSMMESLSLGVPIIAIPMQYDQPINSRLLVELGVGLEVVREENGELRREVVPEVIRQVVGKKNGEEIKRKAKELSEIMRTEDQEDINYMVKELTEICESKNEL